MLVLMSNADSSEAVRSLTSETSRTETTQSWQVVERDASRYMKEGDSEKIFRTLKEMDR